MYLLAGSKEEVKRSDDVMRVVAALLESAGPDVVMARLTGGVFGAASGRGGVAAKAGQASSPEVPLPEAPLNEAARRWAERKEAMLRDNDVVTAVELAGMTGSTAINKSSRANEWRSDGRIFGVNDGKQRVYPLFQIKEGRPHELVGQLLRLLRPKMTDWEIFAWFTAPDMWSCQGRRPVDLLDESPKAVVEAARHAVADTWD
jgi:sirohydrochlorin ferrochelatase